MRLVRISNKEAYSAVSYEMSLNIPLMREDFGLGKDVEFQGVTLIDGEPVYLFESLKRVRRHYSDVEAASFIDETGEFDPNRILETIYDPGRATISEVEKIDTGFEVEFILMYYEGIRLSEEKEKRYMYQNNVYPYDEGMKELLSKYVDDLPEPEDGLYIV